jgi:hypothetical protein
LQRQIYIKEKRKKRKGGREKEKGIGERGQGKEELFKMVKVPVFQ